MSGDRVSVDLTDVDLERYDFPGLRADIRDVIEVQSAVLETLRWTVLIPLVGTTLTWIVFVGRMPRWVLVPYIVLVAAAFVVAAVAVGVFLVLRKRIAETNEAADRVVTTVAAIHGDYLRIRRGEATLPMADLAAVLTRELVFPALTAGSGAAFEAASTTTGPLGFLLRPVVRYPLALVERRVLEALETVEVPEPPPPTDGPQPPPIEGSDLVAAALVPDLPPELDRWYTAIHSYLSRAVGGAGTVATGSMAVLVAVAVVPVTLLLLAGWVLT